MSGRFGDALTAALEGGDLAPIRACLLQRVRMEAGLDELAGRDAVLSWLQALAAAFAEVRVTAVREIRQGDVVLLDCRLEGSATAVPLPSAGVLPQPVAAELPLTIWFRLEGELAGEAIVIADWTGVLGRAGLGLTDVARAMGACSPCHRPLGEPASGRGQLGPAPAPVDASPGARWVAAFNARSLPGCEQCRRLVAQLPDAALVIEQELAVEDTHILLLRLMGHSEGRRVGIAAHKLVGRERDGGDPLRFDRVALAAVGHRPFFPE
jgi:hypothetical protein